MRALLIDPFEQTITVIDYDGSLDMLQKLVGGNIEIAHIFDNEDTLFVNEEGLALQEDAIKGKAEAWRSCAFDIGAHQPFSGRGVIVGEEIDEKSTDCKTTVDELKGRIAFMVPGAFAASGPIN